jgi:ubiquinone/menaquinone biosynthesis C-methylase UbiE
MREAYYDWRAPEYDDFWNQRRLYAGAPASWFVEREAILELVAALPPVRTLDVACGTGFVTSRLRGAVTALDQSARMLAIAETQAPDATLVQGSAFDLPFPDGSFDRVFTSHFYGHLEEHEREPFLAEARRVAPELIVLDAALHGGVERSEWQERELHDGTQWTVYKRFFSEETLLRELGRGTVLFSGTWFICVRTLVTR